jgi:gliding motility-associated-like protein
MLLGYKKGSIRACLLLSFYFLITYSALAQGEGNIWTFGNSAGLDFSSGAPVPIMKPVPDWSAYEGTATICNAAGELLMYTNGAEVYDKNGNIMPNGDDLTSVSSFVTSTTQGSVIVPSPGHAMQYYLFTLGESVLSSGTLSYSIIDMSLNGGLGDVVVGQKAIAIDSLLTEKMTVITKDCNSAWLMVRSRNFNEYKAYEIDSTGISTVPVISTVGNGGLDNYSIGSINFSPDGTKMVASLLPLYSNPPNKVGLELYDFDRNTGLLSNPLTLDSLTDSLAGVFTYYSACFSPDNSKLYGSHHLKLVQFDLSLPTPAQIIASRTVIQETTDTTWFGADIKAGPDSKIYILNGRFGSLTYIHRIDYPNLAGTGCQFVLNAITLLPGTNGLLGFPNEVITFNDDLDTITKHSDTIACSATTISASNNAPAYLWNTGSSDKTITVTTEGIYWVQYLSDCQFHIDSFLVSFATPPEIDLGMDTFICSGTPIQLWLHLDIGSDIPVRWSTGSTTPSIQVTDTGTYWVVGAYVPCQATDSIYIGAKQCGCSLNLPSAFSPNGDGLNDIFIPVYSPGCNSIKQYSLQVFNRWGQLVFNSNNLDKGWNGYYKDLPADVGTYFYQLHYYRENNRDEIRQKGDIMLLY